VFGPLLSRLAAGYAALSLQPTVMQLGVLVAGLALAATGSTVWVTRSAMRESVVTGLAA